VEAVTLFAIGAAAVLTVILIAAALSRWDGHRAEDRREGLHRAPRPARRVPPQRARAGAARAWRRFLGGSRRLPGAIANVLAISHDGTLRARNRLQDTISVAETARTWARQAIARRIQALRWWLTPAQPPAAVHHDHVIQPSLPAPVLDYAPAEPFTDWLSDDTIARGMAPISAEVA